MELKEFIQKTLSGIVDGVGSANENSSNTGRFRLAGGHDGKFQGTKGTYVDFDVGLLASESKEGKSKVGVGVALANIFQGGASSSTTNKNENQNVHRIKFKVFISED